MLRSFADKLKPKDYALAERILPISYDLMLLTTQHQLLRARGYEVVSALNFEEAVELCRKGSYDLVVVGHSIPHNEKERLLQDINLYCPVPVIALMRTNEPPFDAATESIDGMHPEAVLEAVERLLKPSRGTSAD